MALPVFSVYRAISGAVVVRLSYAAQGVSRGVLRAALLGEGKVWLAVWPPVFAEPVAVLCGVRVWLRASLAQGETPVLLAAWVRAATVFRVAAGAVELLSAAQVLVQASWYRDVPEVVHRGRPQASFQSVPASEARFGQRVAAGAFPAAVWSGVVAQAAPVALKAVGRDGLRWAPAG